MRIGTWNLAGRWDSRHDKLIRDQHCDAWLLTEVSERVQVDGFHQHCCASLVAPRRRWAGILSMKPLIALADPHPASAMARCGEWVLCSSVLPWRSCGGAAPWVGKNHAARTAHAVESIVSALPSEGLIWGGDWNHALSGRENSGSIGGRKSVLAAIERLRLKVPTQLLPHRIPDWLTIDHVAVGQTVGIIEARRIDASLDGNRLSDHDAYVIETAEPF